MNSLSFVHYPEVIRGDQVAVYRNDIPVGDIAVVSDQEFFWRFGLGTFLRNGREVSLEGAKAQMESSWREWCDAAGVDGTAPSETKIKIDPHGDVLRLVSMATTSQMLAGFMQGAHVKRLLGLMSEEEREEVLTKARRSMRKMLDHEKAQLQELVDGRQ